MELSGPNQLWIADITYIRLRIELVYLAVILDGFSRMVVGWALDRTLQAKLPLRALARAIAHRQPAPGVVHHSDQGVQYVCREYMEALRGHRMVPSMSRPANPYDNATCEFSEYAQARRDQCHCLSRLRTATSTSERIHRSVLQPVSPTFSTLLPIAGRIRKSGSASQA